MSVEHYGDRGAGDFAANVCSPGVVANKIEPE